MLHRTVSWIALEMGNTPSSGSDASGSDEDSAPDPVGLEQVVDDAYKKVTELPDHQQLIFSIADSNYVSWLDVATHTPRAASFYMDGDVQIKDVLTPTPIMPSGVTVGETFEGRDLRERVQSALQSGQEITVHGQTRKFTSFDN